jgi:hypothetical protein
MASIGVSDVLDNTKKAEKTVVKLNVVFKKGGFMLSLLIFYDDTMG